MITLTHPNHGMKQCTLEAEAAADERNGWVRVIDSPLSALDDVEAGDGHLELIKSAIVGTFQAAPDAPKKRGPKPKAK